MRKKTISVLLNGWGGFAGTSIIDCLKNNFENRNVKVICTDIEQKPLLQHKADDFYILPKGNSKNYVKSLLNLCKKEQIDVIMPGSAPEIYTVSKNLNLLISKNIFPTVSDFASIKKTLDKVKTYQTLQKFNIPTPKFFRVKNKKQFLNALKSLGYPTNPICFKPSPYVLSGGARGFRILRKENTLEKIILHQKPGSSEIDYQTALNFVKNTPKLDLLVMEYLPGKEYSVYVFADKGHMLYCIPNLRERLQQFYSFEASTQKNKMIKSICRRIIEALNLDYNINIQLKLSKNGKPKVVEINPRMGGSIVLPCVAGINLPYLAVKHALKEKIPKQQNFHKAKMIRYWKEFFIVKKNTFEYS